ncbi:MAG: tRNA pseudouridine(55) synthase TruB, partial [Leptospiraceae bacterium]|nr:tRNA pseudouridine(55) synthase TruB [Leptospiraceae bacterium]
MEKGFLLINKPEGITSSDLVVKVRKILNIKKIGHTGTLDKFASGLMILPFGKYTVFSNKFLNSNKIYSTSVVFGKSTDSGDRDGNILKKWEENETQNYFKNNKEFIEKKILEIPTWTTQIPPKISALKVKGKRQAELFRNNIAFEQKERDMKISNFSFRNLNENGFDFSLEVSAGTYIRKIVIDLSENIKMPMYVSHLNRLGIGKFSLEQANSLEDIQKGSYKIYSLPELLNFSSIEVEDDYHKFISTGRVIKDIKQNGEFLLISKNNDVLA